MAREREAGWDIAWPVEAPWEAYYAALGRLVQMFGRTEVVLHKVLKSIVFDYTNAKANPLDWEVLDALTGPMRVAGLRDGIKRILRVVEADETIVKQFDYAFAQLGEIHFFRDRIVHHGADASSHDEGKFYTSNDMTTRESSQQDILIFDVEMMLDMAYDLRELSNYLELLEDDLFSAFIHQGTFDFYAHNQRPTWRYKPSSLKKAGPKHWTKPQAPKRQRAPFAPSRPEAEDAD